MVGEYHVEANPGQEGNVCTTYVHSHSPPRSGFMSFIRLEILPWLSRAFDGTGATHVVQEHEVVEGSTVGELLDRLAADNSSFCSILYEPDGKLAAHISIIINSRLFELSGGLATELHSGDTVRLLPAFSGG
jgi:molybdopterin converting factor small subunit